MVRKAAAVSTRSAPPANESAQAKLAHSAAHSVESSTTAEARPVHLAAQARKANSTAPLPELRHQQVVRVCNAHPDVGGLSVWQDDGDSLHIKLTDRETVAPKTCREFPTAMGLGDFLEFRIPSAREPLYLPAAPVRPRTVALIVVYEKKKEQPGLWVHYFDHLVNAQVAAVNVAPGGSTDAAVQLKCVAGACGAGTNDTLPFGDVHALFPGRYAVTAPDGASLQLDAEGGGSYAVLSMAPGEAMVFPPQKPPQALFSGTASKSFLAVFTLAAAAVLSAL